MRVGKAQPAQNVFNFEVHDSALVSHKKHSHTLQQKPVRQDEQLRDDGQSDTFVEALNNQYMSKECLDVGKEV